MADKAFNVLLLEDEGVIRGGIKLQVQMAEPLAQILEASSSDQALKILAESEIDVAFLDIDAPARDAGLAVLQHIRDADYATRVIMLSGRDDRETVMKCMDLGASGYIVKNMDPDGLFRRALDTVFSGGIFLPASVMGRGGFSPAPPSEAAALTPGDLGIRGRTLETLYYVSLGMPNKAIANHMNLSPNTISKDYMPKLFEAFKVARRTEIIVELSRRNIKVPVPANAKAKAS